MQILKELNLNGNPQTVPNGSLVYAKNIKLSDDGTYITNDDGFDTAFVATQPNASDLKVSNIRGTFVESLIPTGIIYSTKSIVGYINCPNEVVLFVYKEYSENETTITLSEIYRAVELKNSDKLALYKVPTAWKYDGGRIIGTYTYNVYQHLIVAIAESDTIVDKQLITIDLNDSSENDLLDKYSCAPTVPICNLTLTNKVKGNPMPHGIYYFFVRYEISDKLYTNWFPIGAPQYALSLDYRDIINHKYAINSSGDTTKHTIASVLVNTDGDSYYNFGFVITFNKSCDYKGYQIGYILQTEDTAVGRLWKTFSFNDGITKSFTFNGGYIEEVSLKDFADNVLNVYNVKALANYNSKLYIGNFKETKYNIIDDEIQACVDGIVAKQVKHIVKTDIQEEGTTLMNTWTYTIDGTSVSITVPADVSSIPFTDFPALVSLMAEKMHGNITWTGEGYNLVFSEYGIVVNPTKKYGGITFGQEWYFNTGEGSFPFVWDEYGYYNEGDGEYIYGRKGFINDVITVSKSTGVENYKTYNSDVIIRTLMPHEVYAFYVHYIRPDGSFTNGYPLNNTYAQFDYQRYAQFYSAYYKRLRDLTTAQAQYFHLEDMVTIDELKDKYVYELYFPDSIDANTLVEDFSQYRAEDGRLLFRTGSGIINQSNTVQLLRIGVRFSNITYPTGYIGCFFTYEKVKSLSIYQAVVTDHIVDNSSILCKSNDVEFVNTRYDGTVFVPHHKINSETGNIESISEEPWYAYINNAAPVLSNATISFLGSTVNRTGLHGGIVMNLAKDNQTIYQPTKYIVGDIIAFDRSVYTADDKELIPFGPVTTGDTYGEEIDATDFTINYNMNYPSFIVEDKLLVYKSPIYIDENLAVHNIVNNIIDTTSFYTEDNYADIKSIWKFSNINLLALTLKKEPEAAVGVINNDKNTINSVVKPVNASDLFKLESCYIQKTHKAYTNYNVKLLDQSVYTNVVRATYPIRNESSVNSWRLLNPLAYHVIDNANGEIVNIFGAAAAFYIHTKNNLLVTSGNAKLEANNTEIAINNNDIFDVEPKEIFTSDLGYGGLKYQQCQLFTQFGYIWYDTDRYKLFRFDNGHLVDINSGIDEILKKYKYEYCYINIDNENNRIFFAFKKQGTYDLTLGYDTLSNKWLSIYDFTFDRSIHTVNYCLFNLGKQPEVYKYSKDAFLCDYATLYSFNLTLPHYGTSSYHTSEPNVAKYCCFDVIFNIDYLIPKVLDSIRWIHEYIVRNTIDNKHPAELKLINGNIINKGNDLTGVAIDIYTDSVDSGLLDLQFPVGSKINDVANVNNPDAYKYPYYDKGVWKYNYFRNNIITPVTDEELTALAQQHGISVDALKDVYKITDKDGNQVYVNNNPAYMASDLRSLIYGKYIAIRFVFAVNNKLKFDNLDIIVQKY